MATRSISTVEPADRPYTVALSECEIVALANWHMKVAKSIPKKLGAATLKFSAENPFRPARDTKLLVAHAKEQIKAHSDRANGLFSIPK